MTRIASLVRPVIAALEALPYAVLALLARFSIAAVFWKSGQTKIEGLAIDLIQGKVELGLPRVTASAIDLFREEYKLPLLPPELAAYLAAAAEHVFPVLILIGLATRLSALALAIMTLVIQIFVYPDAYALHGTWLAVLLMLAKFGPGSLSVDAAIANRST
ncbi:MAG TPA: DoxX family protein [Beijerinckiaceae bacterium]|nr:DoxX family protein [Beijerinckiaceae bacterium]